MTLKMVEDLKNTKHGVLTASNISIKNKNLFQHFENLKNIKKIFRLFCCSMKTAWIKDFEIC